MNVVAGVRADEKKLAYVGETRNNHLKHLLYGLLLRGN